MINNFAGNEKKSNFAAQKKIINKNNITQKLFYDSSSIERRREHRKSLKKI